MAVLVSDLVAKIRRTSDLRQNQYFANGEIIDLILDADQELRDEIMKANEHHLLTSVDFTLNGGFGEDNDTFPLPDDFYQGHSVDGNPDNLSNQYTVRYLTNWLERNKYRLAFRPVYFLRGTNLVMYPANRAQGDYRLWYTPKSTPFAVPVTVDLTLDDETNPTVGPNYPTTGYWAVPDAGFTESMIGGTFTPALEAPNTDYNIEYTILDVLSPTFIEVTPVPDPGSFTSPAAGTAQIYYQPVGTRPDLDPVLDQFSRFHVLHASLAIRTDRGQDTTDLDRQLNAPYPVGYRAHVISAVTNRAEEPVQPPLTRRDGYDIVGSYAEWPLTD